MGRPVFAVEPMTVEAYQVATEGLAPWEDLDFAPRDRIDAGPCWEAWAGGEVAAVAGLQIKWPGVAEAWLVITDAGRKHPHFLARNLRRLFTETIKKYGLHRVQADVRVGHTEGYLLVEWLRMEEEGVMRKFTPDKQDHSLWAWTEQP